MINDYREKAKIDICNNFDEIIPESVADIFVVGFSSTVLKLLEKVSTNRPKSYKKITVHVLECSTKRRLVHSNFLEYSDGAHYAIEIGKLGYFNTKLIPDLGFATVLDSAKTSASEGNLSQTALVLFGANGIDTETGDCGHTSGHLMVSIVAKQFNVPVKVVSDSFKLGKIGWNINATRKGNWFSTQRNIVNDLSCAHVEVINMREDRIPIDLITEIHIESGNILSCIDADPARKIIDNFNGVDELCSKIFEYFRTPDPGRIYYDTKS